MGRVNRCRPWKKRASGSYQASLDTLADSLPRVARSLLTAEDRRTARLAGHLCGVRLKGLEQLHTYLDLAEESYKTIPDLAALAFLIARVRADFQTALEATLFGYQGVASDAMRDVMEIEGLLLDFAANPGNAGEWLGSDWRMRTGRRKYGPGTVRGRLKDAGIERIQVMDSSLLTTRHIVRLCTSPHRPIHGVVADLNQLMSPCRSLQT